MTALAISTGASWRDSARGEPDGYYPTEMPVARAIATLEPWPRAVWEPAAGCGRIVRAFREAGHRVVATDLVDRGLGGGRDFLEERALLAPAIVTNPPFHLAEAFLRHALDLGAEQVALLLRLAWLEGQDRFAGDTWTRGFARVWVSARRTTMKRGGWDGGRGGGSMVAFGWFVWRRGHEGPAELRHFDWADWGDA